MAPAPGPTSCGGGLQPSWLDAIVPAGVRPRGRAELPGSHRCGESGLNAQWSRCAPRRRSRQRRRPTGDRLGYRTGPPDGVPVAIKVNSDQAGYATTNGVMAFKDEDRHHRQPARGQPAAVRRDPARAQQHAGFSYRWFANNDLHGRTQPMGRSRTPGGSSGGASSAVRRAGPDRHGNDIGGSVRYPPTPAASSDFGQPWAGWRPYGPRTSIRRCRSNPCCPGPRPARSRTPVWPFAA